MNKSLLCLVAGFMAGAFAGAVFAHGKPVESQLGNVAFAVSCSAEAQAKFHRAVALYHLLDWGRGGAAFSEIAQLDPRCGMAYWGLAMIYSDNPFA